MRQIKMTRRIVQQIEQYIAITETAHFLEQAATVLAKDVAVLGHLPVRSSRRSAIAGSRRRIMFEIDTIKKEVKSLKQKRFDILCADARLAIKYSIAAKFDIHGIVHNKCSVTNSMLVQLGAENIGIVLEIPLGTVLGEL